MQCKSCGSKWESKTQVASCPFCGANLKIDKDPKDTDISDVIENLVSTQGVEILKNAKLVISYVMDLVQGHDRDKKLFRVLCNYDVLNGAYKIATAKDDLQKDIIIKKLFKVLIDEAFLSDENAADALNIVLRGLGVQEINAEKSIDPIASKSTNTVVVQQVPNSVTVAPTKNNTNLSGSDRQYDAACRLKIEAKEKLSVAKIDQAIELFSLLDGHKDSDQQIADCEQLRLEIMYEEALKEKNSAASYRDAGFISQILDRAATMFEKLGDYKDASIQVSECKALKLKRIYQLAEETKSSADKYRDETIYSKALMLYGLVKGYEDADDQAKYCAEQLDITHKDAVYRKAVALSQKDDKFSLDCAIENFNKIIDWKDSRELCVACYKKKQEIAIRAEQQKKQKAEEERQKAAERAEMERKQILATRMANGLCAFCGGEFRKRLFHEPVCKNCGREKSYK